MSALTTKESSRTYTGNRSFLINPRTGRATCVHYPRLSPSTHPLSPAPLLRLHHNFGTGAFAVGRNFIAIFFAAATGTTDLSPAIVISTSFYGKTDGHVETDSRGVLSASRWRLFTIVNPFSCEIYILTRMTFSDSREFESIFCGFQLKRTVSLFPLLLLKFSRSLFYNFFRNIYDPCEMINNTLFSS